MTRLTAAACVLLVISIAWDSRAQEPSLPAVGDVPLQPLAAHARALTEAMDYLGAPLPADTLAALDAAYRNPDAAAASLAVQAALDAHCLVAVDINPESRV